MQSFIDFKNKYPLIFWCLFPITLAVGVVFFLCDRDKIDVVSKVDESDQAKREEVEKIKEESKDLDVQAKKKEKEANSVAVEDNWYEKK